jgi:beta-barrel assembly-enhancing protease
LRRLLQIIRNFLHAIRWVVAAILAIGLPLYIYLAFIAKEPVFGPADDVELGKMSAQSLAAEPEEYPILPEGEYPEAYEHLRRIVGEIIGSPEIRYRDLFAYDQVKIIDRDDVLNAFCTPGGYVYVYTGLIKYLDHEEHLAGVLAHEIAHAEKRHGSLRLQKEYGVKALTTFLLLTVPISTRDYMNAKILKDLMGLSYDRDQEAEADEYSVRYLATSDYACDGAAGFFIKLRELGDDARVPEILSDHPDPAARIDAIRREAKRLGCSIEPVDPSRWKAFQQSLPRNDARSEGVAE